MKAKNSWASLILIWMKTKKGKILSIPYPVEINDAPAILYRHHTPEQFARMFMDQLDVLLDESEKSDDLLM